MSSQHLERIAARLSALESRVADLERDEKGHAVDIQSAIGEYLLIRNLVGFWPGSVMYDQNVVMDISGQGHHLWQGTGLGIFGHSAETSKHNLTYIFLDGTDTIIHDYSEAFYPYGNGLTVGLWLQMKALPTAGNYAWPMCCGRTDLRSYHFTIDNSGAISFVVSPDGGSTNQKTVTSSTTIAVDTWYFVVGRWTQSSSLQIYVNEDSDENTTSIPASIYENDVGLAIGGSYNLANKANMWFRLAFLAMEDLVPAHIENIYNISKQFML